MCKQLELCDFDNSPEILDFCGFNHHLNLTEDQLLKIIYNDNKYIIKRVLDCNGECWIRIDEKNI